MTMMIFNANYFLVAFCSICSFCHPKTHVNPDCWRLSPFACCAGLAKKAKALWPWNRGHCEKTTLKWKQPPCLFSLWKCFILWREIKILREPQVSCISSLWKCKQLGKLFLHLYLFFSFCLSGSLKPMWITVTGKACQDLFLNSTKMSLESVLYEESTDGTFPPTLAN